MGREKEGVEEGDSPIVGGKEQDREEGSENSEGTGNTVV